MTVPLIATQSEFLSSCCACQRACPGPNRHSGPSLPASQGPCPELGTTVAGAEEPGVWRHAVHAQEGRLLPVKFIQPWLCKCDSCSGTSAFT